MNIYFYRSTASVYGTDVYGCGTYQHDGSCAPASNDGNSGAKDDTQTTTQAASSSFIPGVPNTSVFAQPTVFIPTLLLVGIFIGTITFLIARKIRQNHQ